MLTQNLNDNDRSMTCIICHVPIMDSWQPTSGGISKAVGEERMYNVVTTCLYAGMSRAAQRWTHPQFLIPFLVFSIKFTKLSIYLSNCDCFIYFLFQSSI